MFVVLLLLLILLSFNLINEINIRLINVIIISRSQFINSLGTIILFFDFSGGGGEVGDVDDLCSRVLMVLLGVDFWF